MDMYYTEITFVVIAAAVVMMLAVSTNNLLSKARKQSIMKLVILLIVTAVIEWFGVFLNEKPMSTARLHSVVKALEYALMPYLCTQILNIADLNVKNRWLRVLLLSNVLYQVTSIFTGFSFYIDENNVCQRGTGYGLYTIFYLICSFYVLHRYIKYGKRFQTSSQSQLIAAFLLSILGITLRQLEADVRLEMLCIMLAVIYMYIYDIDILQKSDPLTGLLNRGCYIEKIAHISEQAAVLYFDVDEFKNINDNYGHNYGDEVLCVVGQTIKEVYAKYGSSYRIGGDEYFVILEKGLENIDNLNTEFVRRLKQKRETDKRLPTVSFGYSLFDPRRDVIEDVIALADKNMYRSKTKLQLALREANAKLYATVRAFQIAAEVSSTLVFIYDLKKKCIIVDERTSKAFGVAEVQEGVPYETAKMGIVSEDTLAEYIRIHEEILGGATQSSGIVKLIQMDGSISTQKLSFVAISDEEGKTTKTAVGIYSTVS